MHELTQQERQSRRAPTHFGISGWCGTPHVHSQCLVCVWGRDRDGNNIAAHESLFRLGIVSQLLGYALWLFVPLALYRLLKDVNRELAALMGWRCWSCLPPVLTAKMGHPQLIEMLPKGLLAGQTHHALYADFKVHHDYPASLALNSPKRDAIPQHADSLLSPLGYDGCHCCC